MNIFQRIKVSWDYRWGLLWFSIKWPFMKKAKVLSVNDTVNHIISTGCSLARFGDGELDIIRGESEGYQRPDKKLGAALSSVLNSDSPKLLVGIPSTLYRLNSVKKHSAKYWKRFLAKHWDKWASSVRFDVIYGDAFISRFHTMSKSPEIERENIRQVRRLWDGRDVVFVEGEYSRLGVGNDCFDNAKSIRRILCPAENAFDRYDEILATVLEKTKKDDLIIMALGPTASVLAYDLSVEGRQALDLGHIDIEYEWWRMGATGKAAVRGKYNNEARIHGNQSSPVEGDLTDDEMKLYHSEIIASIL